jgi:hypothetical protein
MSTTTALPDALIRALPSLEQELRAEGKPLSFLALFLRGHFLARWDLVVGGAWIDQNESGAIVYLIEKLKAQPTLSQWLSEVGRVATVNHTDPLIATYHKKYLPVEDSRPLAIVRNARFFDHKIEIAILFRIPSTA